jgi:hypothetical protein
MNKIFTLIVGFMIVMFLSVTVYSAPIPVPSKYDLGKQLEEVQWFWRTGRAIDWEAVDNQSVVIKTTPGRYYLLILTVPSYNLPFEINRIGITNNRSQVKRGIDSVIVWGPGRGYYNTYPIERIYKIDGLKNMQDIVNQLKAQKGETHNY